MKLHYKTLAPNNPLGVLVELQPGNSGRIFGVIDERVLFLE